MLGNAQLRAIAHALVRQVKATTTVDWTLKESVRAKLHMLIKRTLKRLWVATRYAAAGHRRTVDPLARSVD